MKQGSVNSDVAPVIPVGKCIEDSDYLRQFGRPQCVVTTITGSRIYINVSTSWASGC